MATPSTTYTYRAGKKVALRKRPDQFVVRAAPEEMMQAGFAHAERVSPHSTRVTTTAADLERAMGSARLVAPTHHAYDAADTGQEFLITDRILVSFKPGTTREQIDDLGRRYGLVLLSTFSDRDFLFQVTDHTGMNPVKLIVKLNEDERATVEAAEHDLNYRMKRYQDIVLPTDARYPKQWHLHTHLEHPDFDRRSSSRCEEAWQLLESFGSSNVVVCVTDDGCKLDHSDFGSDKFAGWAYFEGNTLVTNGSVGADPSKMYQSDANHGTSCNGVVAASVDALRTVGGAPGCRLLPIKWEVDPRGFLLINDSKLLTVLAFIADKVDVVSSSWGASPEEDWSVQVVNRIRELTRTGGRRGRGILFLWAAGNENCPISHVSDHRIPFTNGIEIRPDGSAVWVGVETTRVFSHNLVGVPGVMYVAALASTATRSHYSNYGTGIAVCAPTNNVHEYHRLSVRGLGIVTTTGNGNGVTTQFGGTSSATPLTAAVAALTISANPQLTALEVESILKQTASKDLDMTPYPRTPPASFDPNTDWDVSPVEPFEDGAFTSSPHEGTWSPWFGHGRVD
ncbi:MAG TPA: S8 family serine peptidase, partial [Candidatus Binatia bacterium]|nr:S8 family serine peptidase [Candidatus Binatia bacterium]